MATQEIRTVQNHFDVNNDGKISYEELINVLRNNCHDERGNMIKAAWEHVSQGAEFVSFEQLCKCFRAQEHPRTTSREKKADQVALEFRDGMSKYVADGNVNWDGFMNYYLDFNCVLPWEKDTYFN